MPVMDQVKSPDILDLLEVDSDFPWGKIPSKFRDLYATALWTLAYDFDGECRAGEAVKELRKRVQHYDPSLLQGKGAASMVVGTLINRGWVTTEGGGAVGARVTAIALNIVELPPVPPKMRRLSKLRRFLPAKTEPTTVHDATNDFAADLRAHSNGDDPRPAPGEGAAHLREMLSEDAHDGHTQSLAPPEDEHSLPPGVVMPDDLSGLDEHFETPTTPNALQSIGARLGTAASLIYETLFELSELRPMAAVDEAVAERLALTLEECARLRRREDDLKRKLNAANETAAAHYAALQGARQMNKTLQENLNKALGKPVDDRAWNELERMIKTAPGTTKGA